MLTMYRCRLVLTFGVLLCWPSIVLAQQPAKCDRVAALKLPNVVVSSAANQPAAAWTLSNGSAARLTADTATGAGASIPLPAFCRVAVTLKPSADSDIEGEIGLPLQNWNGKFQEVGNGGWAGSITY